MKLRFEAIDGRGRVTRGVLRAESADEARELLVEEQIYAKRLEPVGEEVPLTWAPKARRTRGGNAPSSDERPVRHLYNTTMHRPGEPMVAGRLGLTESGLAVFEPADAMIGALAFPVDSLEVVALTGLVARRLRLVLLNGRTIEFEAGTVFADSAITAITRHLQSSRKQKD